MRKISSLVAVFLLTFSMVASAEDNSLKANMKELGGLFKQIVKTANDSTENSKNAASASRMRDIFKVVQTQVPDSIRQLPPNQQAAALAGFQSTIQKEIDLATQLAQAFSTNDSAKALQIIDLMSKTKKAGHEKYDPET